MIGSKVLLSKFWATTFKGWIVATVKNSKAKITLVKKKTENICSWILIL
jgi:hypothetical protein